MNALTVPPSPVPHLRTIEITPEHEATLQRFFEANPEYYLFSNGEPAGPDEAHKEIHDDPPAKYTFARRWLVGWLDDAGEMAAMAHVVSDMLAPRVWHIGYFLVATSTYGTGLAQTLYASLERWMHGAGADWLRLGVIVGNMRAERFWAAQGYLETRVRHGLVYGRLTHSISVRVKPLEGGTVDQYLERVPRDRPDGPA